MMEKEVLNRAEAELNATLKEFLDDGKMESKDGLYVIKEKFLPIERDRYFLESAIRAHVDGVTKLYSGKGLVEYNANDVVEELKPKMYVPENEKSKLIAEVAEKMSSRLTYIVPMQAFQGMIVQAIQTAAETGADTNIPFEPRPFEF